MSAVNTKNVSNREGCCLLAAKGFREKENVSRFGMEIHKIMYGGVHQKVANW